MPLSAYPPRYKEALASEAILPPEGLRLATYSKIRPVLESALGGYFVPNLSFDADFRILSLHRVCCECMLVCRLISQPLILSLLGQAQTAFWLVLHNDDSVERFVFLSMTSYARRDSTLG
ncbi:hypothetical protein [Mastigocladopsis repens]|uniref:hypothetical protein n=1 Tax=Mastigocladopsis repens TaxID=221287 RepID=UPI0012EA6419|nr:hypothetical protein [Mastigocladopsis repens]